ncbi:MAG TPA: 30S ribosomal protein S4 [Clostridia bacterium]|nr:30S ribosomal protein S4 [Clostridia bacterium]
MAKYTGPACRLCRREGCKLFLKGDKCFSEKCIVAKRPTPPGIHGMSRKKPTAYSFQLREKQKAKRIYGLTEKQFHSYYEKAEKMRGATGESMLCLLERRLDNVVYRMGIGISRAQSRQIVNHGHITVNGRNVNIPSYLVKAGDVVAIKENKQNISFFADLKAAKVNNRFKWLEFKPEELKGTVLALPARDDIDMTIAEHMIVELYSK